MIFGRRSPVVCLSLAVCLGVLIASPVLHAQSTPLCFSVPAITSCIEGRFLEFWSENGGLPVFGYPLTSPTPQQTQEGSFLTQSFERTRFELHPEKARPYDVLLGRLGDERLKQQGSNWMTFPKADENAPHYFPETGHAIAHDPFWRYWSSHGLEFDGKLGTSFAESLALFGLPLSEPTMEINSSSDIVLTQWFERARLEDHGGQGVLLGLLGNETRGGTSSVELVPPLPSEQRMVFRPVADAFVHADFPDSNFGRDGLLVADLSPNRESYLKFEVQGLNGTVAKADLLLYVTTLLQVDGSSFSGGSIARMQDTSWQESSVTYNSRPRIDGPILATLGQVKAGQWYAFDVTAAITGNGLMSFGLISRSANGVYYTSREVTETAPQLLITLAR